MFRADERLWSGKLTQKSNDELEVDTSNHITRSVQEMTSQGKLYVVAQPLMLPGHCSRSLASTYVISRKSVQPQRRSAARFGHDMSMLSLSLRVRSQQS